MNLSVPTISAFSKDLPKAILSAKDGVLALSDLPAAPFEELRSTFDFLSSPAGKETSERLNRAYTKNLVYKDSFASGNGGATVDMKRVLDLSPERLDTIEAVDPNILVARESFAGTLQFWERLSSTIVPNVLSAVAEASGSDDILRDAASNYRMVDYYARPASSEPPRCGEHRDFGTFTLVFATEPGFEVYANGNWCSIDPLPAGSALLLFGWCTQIRSNGRIPAALHRVSDSSPPDSGPLVPRRTSAVLFVAPKMAETALEPVVQEGEQRKYISGIQVGMLRGSMARKWRHREGTLNAEDKILEEEEILATRMKTQDDVVARTIVAV